jgi:hypothetical protein
MTGNAMQLSPLPFDRQFSASMRRAVHSQVVASHLLEKGCPHSGRVTKEELRKEALYDWMLEAGTEKQSAKGAYLSGL